MSTNNAPAPETNATPALSPKLAQAVKAFVTWDASITIQKSEKLKTLEQSIREEMQKKDITRKQMTSLLILAGLDPQTTSKLITLADPKDEAAAKQLAAADQHNAQQDGKKGNIIGFDERRKIASGKATLQQVLQQKTANRAARPQGNATSTSTSTGVITTPTQYDAATVKAKVAILIANAKAGGMSLEDIEEAIGEEIESQKEAAQANTK